LGLACGLLVTVLGAAVPFATAQAAEQLDIPDLAVDGRGNFVVVWQGGGSRGGGEGIVGRRYDRDEVPRGGEFHVNTFTTGRQSGAAVAMDAVGNFVVVWAADHLDGVGPGIYGRRYDSKGVPRGGEFPISTYRVEEAAGARIRMDAAGNFVVTWRSGSGPGRLGRRYDGSGMAVGPEFTVDPSAPLG
jgi:hypothetical protein